MEKQKCRWHFGIMEKQFQRYVVKASRMKGAAGENLVNLLQARLDNIIWRLGLARTIPQARQIVVHGHVMINGRRVDRPSFHVSAGDEISLRDKSKSKPFIAEVLESTSAHIKPSWLEFDPAKTTGKLISKPDRADLPFDLNENAIIEFYSQKL